MTIKANHIIIALLLILCGFLVYNTFKGGNTKLEVDLAASEEREKAAIREREMYRTMYNNAIEEKRQADSLLKIKDKQVIIRYEKIPVTVRAMPKDSLRRAVEEFTD